MIIQKEKRKVVGLINELIKKLTEAGFINYYYY